MKMRIQMITMSVLVTLLMASCSKPAEAPKAIDMDKLKVEIQAMEDAYAAAEKAKNADAVAVYYSEDAVSYNRNEEPTSGRAAIRDRIAKRLEKDTVENTEVYKIVDLYAEGNMVVEIGSWTELSLAGEETNKGYYLSYFQNRDGKWLCVRDMNVTTKSDKPAM